MKVFYKGENAVLRGTFRRRPALAWALSLVRRAKKREKCHGKVTVA